MPAHKTSQKLLVTGPIKIEVEVDYEFEECCAGDNCNHYRTDTTKDDYCSLFGKLKTLKKKSKDDGETDLKQRHKQCREGKKTK